MGYGRGDDQRSEKKRKKGKGRDRGIRRRKTEDKAENKEMNNKGEGVKEELSESQQLREDSKKA